MAKTKQDNAETEKQRIVTPEFRVSYPHVFKPNAMKGSVPKYSVTMLFPKTKDITPLKKAIYHAKMAEFGPDKAKWPQMASLFKDGDSPKYADKEGHKGHWAIKAASNEHSRPGVVSSPEDGTEPIVDPKEFYPGCYARAQVFARVWEFPENSGLYGVHLILDHVQKLRDGKQFGGKKSAKEAFGAMASDGEEEDESY